MNTSITGQNEADRAVKKSTVLIIDFDPDSLSSLANFIQSEGFEVLTARDGLTGWDYFRDQHPSLVIMEAMLPKLNGFELCKKIVSDSRGATPVIMITGIYREISYRIEALQIYGASAFYSKPWNREDLRQRVYQLLNLESGRPACRKEPEKAAISAEPSLKQKTATTPAKESSTPSPPEPNPKTGATMINNADDTQTHLKQPEQKVPAKEKKSSLDQDIEGMLKDTLAGLGLGAEAKKPAVKAEAPRIEPRHTEPPKTETFRPGAPKAEPAGVEFHRHVKPEPRPAEPPRHEPPRSDFPQVDDLRAQFRRPEAVHHETVKTPAPARESKPVEKPIPEVPRAEKPMASRLETILAATEAKKSSVSLDVSETKAFQKTGERETMDVRNILPFEPAEKRPRRAAEAVFPATADRPRERTIERPEPEPVAGSSASFGVFEEPRKKPAPLVIGGVVLGFLLVSGTFYLILKPKKAALVELAVTPLSSEAPVINYAGDSSGAVPEQDFRSLVERLSTQVPGFGVTKTAVQKKAPEKPPAFQAEPAAAPILDAASELKLSEQADPKNEAAKGAAAETNAAGQDPRPADTQPKPAAESAAPVYKPGDLVPYAEIDVAPEIIRRVEAQYPRMARQMGAEGSVTVNALISETGSVIRTEILKGLVNAFGLEKAAEDAVKQWKFSPAQKAGVPVKVWKAIQIVFRREE